MHPVLQLCHPCARSAALSPMHPVLQLCHPCARSAPLSPMCPVCTSVTHVPGLHLCHPCARSAPLSPMCPVQKAVARCGHAVEISIHTPRAHPKLSAFFGASRV